MWNGVAVTLEVRTNWKLLMYYWVTVLKFLLHFTEWGTHTQCSVCYSCKQYKDYGPLVHQLQQFVCVQTSQWFSIKNKDRQILQVSVHTVDWITVAFSLSLKWLYSVSAIEEFIAHLPNNHWSTLLYDKAKGNIKPLSMWRMEKMTWTVFHNRKGYTAKDIFK